MFKVKYKETQEILTVYYIRRNLVGFSNDLLFIVFKEDKWQEIDANSCIPYEEE